MSDSTEKVAEEIARNTIVRSACQEARRQGRIAQAKEELDVSQRLEMDLGPAVDGGLVVEEGNGHAQPDAPTVARQPLIEALVSHVEMNALCNDALVRIRLVCPSDLTDVVSRVGLRDADARGVGGERLPPRCGAAPATAAAAAATPSQEASRRCQREPDATGPPAPPAPQS